jgi:hypothetical protein
LDTFCTGKGLKGSADDDGSGERDAMENELGLNAMADEREDALLKDIAEKEIVYSNILSVVAPLVTMIVGSKEGDETPQSISLRERLAS